MRLNPYPSLFPYRKAFVAALCILAVGGCRGVASSGSGVDQGKLGIWVTDPGISEFDRLEITITSVDIKPQDSVDPIRVELDRPLVVDLTRVAQRTNEGRQKIFDNQVLPIGRYEWIELNLDETRLFIEDQGSQFPVTIPPDQQNNLRLVFNAAVDDTTTLDLTIDFNAAKTLRETASQTFELHPDLRLVRTERAGTLDGIVAENLVRDGRCRNGTNHDEGNRVYLYNGTANFQDLQDRQDPQANQGNPLIVAPVTRGTSDNNYEFSIGFLPNGRYTAVFTCDASVDNPEEDNTVEMNISELLEVSIDAGQTTSIFFQASF